MSDLIPGISLRKCFVLRDVEIKMEELREGDIFRLQPACPEDAVNVDRYEYSIAKGAAGKVPGSEWNCSVESVTISFVESVHPRQINFSWNL